MPGRRHLPGAHEAIGSGEPTSRHGLLTWWQRRSRRTDLAVLARVRDGLRRLDAEPDGEDHASPQLAEPPALEARACPPALPPAAPSAPEDSGDLLPDSAIVSIRDTFRIVLAAGGEPAGYFYGRLFASHPRLRAMFPPAMDEQRDRLLRALARIVDGLSSPEDLVEYLTQLGRDHRKYSVEPAMYDVVGEVLIATLRTFAGAAFTPGAEEAWRQAYQAASALMIRAAEDDSAVAPAYWTAEVVANEQRQPGLAILTVAPCLSCTGWRMPTRGSRSRR